MKPALSVRGLWKVAPGDVGPLWAALIPHGDPERRVLPSPLLQVRTQRFSHREAVGAGCHGGGSDTGHCSDGTCSTHSSSKAAPGPPTPEAWAALQTR